MKGGSEAFMRTQPMVSPTFAKQSLLQECFFVPNWQLNRYFDDFITGGDRGDFQDHMPYVTVRNLFTAIDNALLLSYNPTSGSPTYGSWFNVNGRGSFTDNRNGYAIWLRRILDVIEFLDITRSAPFTVPDFLDPSSVSSQPDLNSLMAANRTAFYSLNSRLDSSSLRINLMPFQAYQKVWCEFYRDENLFEDYYNDYLIDVFKIDELLDSQSSWFLSQMVVTSSQTSFDAADSQLLHFWYLFGAKPRAWKKDLFTSALPFVQKGPDVLLPIGGTVPVNMTVPGSTLTSSASGNISGSGSGTPGTDINVNLSIPVGSGLSAPVVPNVDLSQNQFGTTITDFRRAVKLEEFYEADGRGGNRYPENTLMQWGVRTPDSRLPRCLYLGGCSQPLSISEVVQTSSTDSTSPQGTLAGKGVSYGNGRLCRGVFTMHGFTIFLFSIRTGAIYEQGIHPMFSRFDRTEYAWPRFAHLGEQPIYRKQLFVDSTVTEDEEFGYGPRYVDYKTDQGSIHGLLKSSLNFWTMSRRFSTKPVLNKEFIYNPPRQDAFAVSNPFESPYILEIDYKIRINRKLPFFGVPML